MNTRNVLKGIQGNVSESMGVRGVDLRPVLSPIANAKDAGRLPLRKFGTVPITQVIPDPTQPRIEFDETEIQRLASSIRTTGQLHPIRVRWDEPAEKWIVVTGERRYRASVAAGLETIDCYFHDDELTSSEILEQQLVENLLRQDLKPLEEAKGYANLMELNDWNGRQVAEALRISPSRVSRSLALLDLPETVQQRINEGELSKSSAYELSKIDNPGLQKKLSEKATESSMTQRRIQGSVARRKKRSKATVRGTNLSFECDDGFSIQVKKRSKCSYHEVLEALEQAIEEVRLRIDNNVQLY